MIIEWRNGGMAGMVIEWRKWWNGGMAEWRNGGNGGTAERMAEWLNGGNGYIRTIYGRHTPTTTTPMMTTTFSHIAHALRYGAGAVVNVLILLFCTWYKSYWGGNVHIPPFNKESK